MLHYHIVKTGLAPMIALRSKLLSTLLAAGACILPALMPTEAMAAATKGACKPTAIKFIASEATFFETTSTTFVVVPQSAVRFRQGGTQSSCVIVRFSANAFMGGAAGTNLVVRPILNINTTALPAEAYFSDGDDANQQARSFDFIFVLIPPGLHTVHMEFRSGDGTRVEVDTHNTIVQYVP